MTRTSLIALVLLAVLGGRYRVECSSTGEGLVGSAQSQSLRSWFVERSSTGLESRRDVGSSGRGGMLNTRLADSMAYDSLCAALETAPHQAKFFMSSLYGLGILLRA